MNNYEDLIKLKIGESVEIGRYYITRIPEGYIYESELGMTFVHSKKRTSKTVSKLKDIKQRQHEFKIAVINESKNTPYSTDIEGLKMFYEYWSEHGVNDIKMRFEKEKTFGIVRRLNTWFSRKSEYSQSDTTSHNTDLIAKRLNKK